MGQILEPMVRGDGKAARSERCVVEFLFLGIFWDESNFKYLRANPGLNSIILVDTVYPDYVGNSAFKVGSQRY